MGRFSKTTQIKNNTDRAGFISAFNDVMAKRGFVPCSEDEAAKSYLLAFSDGWVTFTSESEDVPQVVKDMNVTSFSVEVVDSDFAILTLNNGDTVIFGDGSGYGIEESPKGERKFWEPLLADGKTWKQFSEVRDKNEVFVEDVLCEAAPILGIDTKYIIADYNELLDMAEGDRNVETLYFKEKAADKKSKPMTLNAAFVKVFGEALEPLGFKKIKSRYPYFVRVVPGGEIIHVISYYKEQSFNPKYDEIDVVGGVATVYRQMIDLSHNPRGENWLMSGSWIYQRLHEEDFGSDFHRSIRKFSCSTEPNKMLDSMKHALEITKQIMLPVMDEVVDIDSCIRYNHKIGLLLPLYDDENFGNDNPNHYYNEGFLYFKTNPSIFRERMKNAISEIALREKTFFEKVQTDLELNQKVQDELERRKKENTEILRSYGLEI